MSETTCGAWGGCPLPTGHNRGRADIPENHLPAHVERLVDAQRAARFWQGLAEYWEREHESTVLPYTSELEDERDQLKAQLGRIRAIAEEAPEPRGALRRRLLAVLNGAPVEADGR